MNHLKWVVWVFLFCVDVHVRAETAHGQAKAEASHGQAKAETAQVDVKAEASDKARETENCWSKQIPCAVKSEHSKIRLHAKHLDLVMARGALLEQQTQNTIRLIKGEFYIETSQVVYFKTPYAKIWCEEECKGYFSRTVDQVNVKSLDGEWLIQRTGETTPYVLRVGRQVLIGEVQFDGKAFMEFPQSLPWSSTVNQWATLYPGSLDEFKHVLARFRTEWKGAVEELSDLHQTEAKRTIASHEKQVAEEQARKLAQEREDESLRAIFREKNP
jgi:hypothetical protein